MKEEIEAKFLNVDFAVVRKKLRGLGAVCEQPMRLMKRAIIDHADSRLRQKAGFIRLRDEGDKVTLTYKQFDKSQDYHVASAQEIETTVGSFDDTLRIFEAMDMHMCSLQESKRETWRLGTTEIMLDEWPWLKPYLEIEGGSEAAVRKTASQLGFDWSDAVFGDVMTAYRAQYPHLGKGQTVGRISEVKFGDPLPELFQP